MYVCMHVSVCMYVLVCVWNLCALCVVCVRVHAHECVLVCACMCVCIVCCVCVHAHSVYMCVLMCVCARMCVWYVCALAHCQVDQEHATNTSPLQPSVTTPHLVISEDSEGGRNQRKHPYMGKAGGEGGSGTTAPSQVS